MARKVEGPIWLLVVLLLAGGAIGAFPGLGVGGLIGGVIGGIVGAVLGFVFWFSDLFFPQK